jgi:hypothetical protein
MGDFDFPVGRQPPPHAALLHEPLLEQLLMELAGYGGILQVNGLRIHAALEEIGSRLAHDT